MNWRRRAVALCVGTLLGLGATEVALRVFKPTPPVQVIRGKELHALYGVPVWEFVTERYNRDCVEAHPERTRILFFGSSITFGVGVSADAVFTAGLQEQLNALRPTPGFCVMNFAQAGYSFEQKFAVARREVERYRPALILWEGWNEWNDYTLVGDAAYGTNGFRLRADGFIGIAGVPDALNRTLLLNSRLYEYLTLILGEASAETRENPQQTFIRERLYKVPELARSVGAQLVFFLAPPLDRPFAELAEAPPAWQSMVVDYGRQQGIPVYLLQHELEHEDYQQLRLDPCCHFNTAGHHALVPVMTRIVLEQLDHQ